MEENTNWAEVPESIIKNKNKKIDHRQFQNLDEGRIPIPVPVRVKSGEIKQDKLIIITSSRTIEVEWKDITMLALGIIAQKIDYGEAPESNMRKILKHVLMGKPDRLDKVDTMVDKFIFDIYVGDLDSPYRIDQALVNYKSFLVNPGYQSFLNFRRLVRLMVHLSCRSRITPCLKAFILNRRDEWTRHGSIFDFDIECQTYQLKETGLIPRNEVHFEIRDTILDIFEEFSENEDDHDHKKEEDEDYKEQSLTENGSKEDIDE